MIGRHETRSGKVASARSGRRRGRTRGAGRRSTFRWGKWRESQAITPANFSLLNWDPGDEPKTDFFYPKISYVSGYFMTGLSCDLFCHFWDGWILTTSLPIRRNNSMKLWTSTNRMGSTEMSPSPSEPASSVAALVATTRGEPIPPKHELWTATPTKESFHLHWKPDTRHPFVQEKNSPICYLFLYAIHKEVKLHDLVLGKNCLIGGILLYPAFLYPVYNVHVLGTKANNESVLLFFRNRKRPTPSDDVLSVAAGGVDRGDWPPGPAALALAQEHDGLPPSSLPDGALGELVREKNIQCGPYGRAILFVDIKL